VKITAYIKRKMRDGSKKWIYVGQDKGGSLFVGRSKKRMRRIEFMHGEKTVVPSIDDSDALFTLMYPERER